MDLPQDLKIYLEEIAERLHSGHASIMVGAGFSKNGIGSPKSKHFPNWHELADIFFEKINGRPPAKDEHYINPLKLAEEVEAAFGRPVLENILLSEIPDTDYQPCPLHDCLLSLPWNDVFTTNYDTLIERASSKASKRFDIVVDQKGLVYSRRPRIIKLHGSFPSTKPFIITEEDYRRYPSEYALFVNTVQQSLIENTLCLIGFSGDDPNFLHWIGWIRDNLGREHSPKIYLIGVFNLPASKIRLLEQKNITIINYSNLLGEDPNKSKHYLAVEKFLKFLESKRKDELKLDWPRSESTEFRTHIDDPNIILAELKKVTSEWKSARLSYPGWMICPASNREKVWRLTKQWISGKHLSLNLENIEGLNFWFELVWRLEICLLPVFEDLLPSVFKIEKFYFLKLIEAREAGLKSIDGETIGEIRGKLVQMGLYLLKTYRQDGSIKKWEQLFERLLQLKDYLSAEQLFSLYYEQSLFLFFNLNLPKFKEHVKALENYETTPYDSVKRAGLLAELGDLTEARTVLEKSLQTIRSQLNLKPITTDYTLVSQEAYTLQLLKYVQDALSLSNESGSKDYAQEFSSRWSELKKYKCDPWNELEAFRLRLDKHPTEYRSTTKNPQFDIGESTTSHHFGFENPELIHAYAFLNFIERIGIPYHVSNYTFGKEQALGAIKRIADTSPNWALISLLRVGDTKSIDLIFSRLALARYSQEKVDGLVQLYLKVLNDTFQDLKEATSWRKGNLGSHYGSFMPEVLSRLATKASYPNLQLLLKFALNAYNDELRGKYSNIKVLIKRVIASWPVDKYIVLLSILIEGPLRVGSSSHPRDRMDYPDPFHFVDFALAKKLTESLNKDLSIIDNLLEKFDSQNEDIYFRLSIMYELGFMDKTQVGRLVNILWKNSDKDGFPEPRDHYRFDYLKYSDYLRFNIYDSFVNFVSNLKMPAVGNSSSISIGGRSDGDLRDASSGFELYRERLSWTEEYAKQLFEKIERWWESDKAILNVQENDILFNRQNEIRSRLIQGFRLLGYVVAPYLTDQGYIERLLIIVEQADSVAIPTTEIKLQLFRRGHISESKLKESLFSCVRSKNEVVSIWAVSSLRKAIKESLSKQDFAQAYLLSSIIYECILWKKFPIIINASKVLADLIHEYGLSFDEFLSSLNVSMDELASETSLLGENENISIEERLEARVELVSLAKVIYQKLKDNNVEPPNGIAVWKSIGESLDEFAEVRNAWAYYDF